MHGLVGCCLRITLVGCLTKVCAQQARVVVSKVEEPEESGGGKAQRGEDQILGASETDSTTTSVGSGSTMEKEVKDFNGQTAKP